MAYGNRGSPVVVVFDIETIEVPLPPEEVERLMAEYEPPRNIKDPEKIEARRREHPETIRERNKFRLGGARLISVALGEVTESGEVRNLDGKASEDSNAVARFFAEYLNDIPSYRLCGYNINNFDIPHMALALYRAGVGLDCPQSKWDPIDLAGEFGRQSKGTGQGNSYKMKELADIFGIPSMLDADGKVMDGSCVQGLYELGELDTILAYNKHDVVMEAKLYRALSLIRRF